MIAEMSGERGLFLSLEGVDGAGKSGHIEALRKFLEDSGRSVVVTREPGGTPLAEQLRTMILSDSMDPLTEALLCFAARRDHIQTQIAPALAAGKVVICDRFTDSTFAYQGGGRGFDLATLSTLEAMVQSRDMLAAAGRAPGPDAGGALLQPDLTLLFYLDPAIAAQRLAGARAPDKFESQPVDFFHAVNNGYLERVHGDSKRFVLINASLSREQVWADVRANLLARGLLDAAAPPEQAPIASSPAEAAAGPRTASAEGLASRGSSQSAQSIQARLAELQADNVRSANVLGPQGLQVQAAEARAKARLCQEILGWVEAGVPLTLADSTKGTSFTEAEKQAEPRIYAHPQDYERREDGKVVRKDRWEWGMRNIVTILLGPRHKFEIHDIVESVRALAERAKVAAQEPASDESGLDQDPDAAASACPTRAMVSAYALDLSPRDHVRIERAVQLVGAAKWAVRLHGDCLNRTGEWEWEPMPSGRDDAFLARCRFDTDQEAIDAAVRAVAAMVEADLDAPRLATAPETSR
ncbi:dTMP kinase [Variovorax sp. JS1663]|uniref:dTMP kinase n=1 Tax=Variovorax sp. JS1663 TaxID=1851577 RepID=UPI0026A202AD